MQRRLRFRDVLAVGEFRAMWAAELLSVAGDQLARVALALLVYQRTSSATWTALTYALTFVPSVVGGLLLSGLADRYPRRAVLITTDAARACLAGAMALPFLPLPALLGLVFLLTLAGPPAKAAQLSLLTQVLPGERYTVGISLRTITSQSAQLAGFLGGGAALLVLTPHTALGINAATFAVAAVVVALGVKSRPAPSAPARGVERGGAAALIWRDRRLRGLIAICWLVGFFVVPEGLAAPYSAGLGGAALAVGVLMAADPAGSVVGAWALARWVPERLRERLITPLAVASGIPLIVCAMRPGLVVSVVLWGLSGAFSTAYLIQAQSSFIRRVPDHRRGAVSGLATTGLYTSQGLAILGAGVVADVIGPARTVALAGCAGAALALLVGGFWLRARRGRGVSEREAGGSEIRSPCSASPAPPPTELAVVGDPEEPAPAQRAAAYSPDQGVDTRSIDHLKRRAQAMTILMGRALRQPSGWKLWTVPRRLIIYMLAVEAFVVSVTVTGFDRAAFVGDDVRTFLLVVGLGLIAAELTRHVERMRRRFSDTPHVNMSSVWTLAAALLLPQPLAAATAVVLYLHLWGRSWYRVRGVHAYRLTFSTSTVILASYSAAAAVHAIAPGALTNLGNLRSMAALGAAVAAYSAVNSGLVAGAIGLLEGRLDLRRMLGSARENAVEYATLGLGLCAAVFVVIQPVMILAEIPALMVLHRCVLLRQLEEAAARDHKTGLLNATAWNSLATAELARTIKEGTTLGVLMVDLDHFKRTNDTYGHLLGDRVLQLVADTLGQAVRSYDIVARFGGEEFVILCPDLNATDLVAVGERICERVRALRVPLAADDDPAVANLRISVSVGAAFYPESGPALDDLLRAADVALFAAKDAGRDRVESVVDSLSALERRNGVRPEMA